MIFTIGHTESYDAGLLQEAEQGFPFKKLGKTVLATGEPYAGGSVWRTHEDAVAYLMAQAPDIVENYSVYGLLADWNTDTEQLDGEPFRRLLKNAQIVHARL